MATLTLDMKALAEKFSGDEPFELLDEEQRGAIDRAYLEAKTSGAIERRADDDALLNQIQRGDGLIIRGGAL